MAGLSVVVFGVLAVASTSRSALLPAPPPLPAPDADLVHFAPTDADLARLLQSSALLGASKSNLQLLIPMLLLSGASGEGSRSGEMAPRNVESLVKSLQTLAQRDLGAPATDDDEEEVVVARLLKALGGKDVTPTGLTSSASALSVAKEGLPVVSVLSERQDDDAAVMSRLVKLIGGKDKSSASGVRDILLGKASSEEESQLAKLLGRLLGDAAPIQVSPALTAVHLHAPGKPCPFCQLLHELQVLKLQALLESEVRKLSQGGAGGAGGDSDEFHVHIGHEKCPLCMALFKNNRRSLDLHDPGHPEVGVPPNKAPVPA